MTIVLYENRVRTLCVSIYAEVGKSKNRYYQKHSGYILSAPYMVCTNQSRGILRTILLVGEKTTGLRRKLKPKQAREEQKFR